MKRKENKSWYSLNTGRLYPDTTSAWLTANTRKRTTNRTGCRTLHAKLHPRNVHTQSVLFGTPSTKGHALPRLCDECLATLHHPPSSPHTVSYLSTLSSQREACTHTTQTSKTITATAHARAQRWQGVEGVVSPTTGATQAIARDLRYILSVPVLHTRA